MIKTKDNRMTKIYATVLVTALVLIGAATYMVLNKSVGAQVRPDSNVSIDNSTVYLVSDTSGLSGISDKILSLFGFGNGEETSAVGAVSTLDGVDNPYVSINGFKTYYQNDPMIATSSVICSRINPFMGTSTVSYINNNLTTGFTVAQNISVSTSSTQYGTSSPAIVWDYALPAGEQDSFFWTPNSTTSALLSVNLKLLPAFEKSGRSNIVVGPGEYLVSAVATTSSTAGVLDTFPAGTCKAIWHAGRN